MVCVCVCASTGTSNMFTHSGVEPFSWAPFCFTPELMLVQWINDMEAPV